LTLALESGAPAERISFAGPGKRDEELAAAIRAGVTVHLESQGETERAVAIGQQLGRAPRVAIRVNPPFGLKGSGMKMGGLASPFGIDAEAVPALLRWLLTEQVEWQGFHVYAGSQSLDPTAITAMQGETVRLVAALAEEAGAAPPLINLGGGFGVPYHAGQERLDLALIGGALGEALGDRPAVLEQSRFAIELGRWLVAEAGVYLTRITDVKQSRGRTFLVCDGGLHHQLAATGNFGAVVRRNYPLALAQDFSGAPDEEPVTVVGPLCTPLDLLGDEVALPPASVGELVAVFLAGAYGLSASPQAFLSQPAARELLL
jgi:diaminopimelate decarboxylase